MGKSSRMAVYAHDNTILYLFSLSAIYSGFYHRHGNIGNSLVHAGCKNCHSDRFEQTKQSPFERNLNTNQQNSETNFFLNDSGVTSLRFFKQEQGKRLNDYDFNLLKEDAYKDIDDDLFKLEYKISRLEEEIKLTDAQIQAARDISDYNLINELVLRKQTLSETLNDLINTYNEKSISARISDGISSLFGHKLKNKFSKFKSELNNITEIVLAKLPKQFTSVVKLKKSLAKLENINRSVDELMSFNAPYGENSNKYEQLSKYIVKANSIQSEISQHMK